MVEDKPGWLDSYTVISDIIFRIRATLALKQNGDPRGLEAAAKWRASQAGGRWPFLVKLYDCYPGFRWMKFSLYPALLESGLIVGVIGMAIVAWGFGQPLDLSESTPTWTLLITLGVLQFAWHLLHLPLSHIVTFRWRGAFGNMRGWITLLTVGWFSLLFSGEVEDRAMDVELIEAVLVGLIIPHTLGNMWEKRRLTLKRRGPMLQKVEELKTWGAEAVDELIKLTRDSDRNVRDAALRALGDIGDRRAEEAVKARLSDGPGNVQAAAAYALHRILGEEAEDTLIALVGKHGSIEYAVHSEIRNLLKRSKNPATRKILFDAEVWFLQRDEFGNNFGEGFQALRELDPRRSVGFISAFMYMEDETGGTISKPSDRLAGVTEIENQGGVHAADRLREIVKDDDSEKVREAARQALERIEDIEAKNITADFQAKDGGGS